MESSGFLGVLRVLSFQVVYFFISGVEGFL